MLLRTTLCVMLAIASVSAVALAGGTVEIPRIIDGTLGPSPTPADVAAMLVGARWHYLNPDKETSTWESKTLVFDALGSVDVTTAYAWGPRTVKAPWHVVRVGPTPTVDIDGVEYRISPCKLTPRVSCLVGLRP